LKLALQAKFRRSREANTGCPIFRVLCEKRGISLVLFTLVVVSASAQTLSGKVTNRTTSKPARGDDVVLLSLGQGMEESGRTQTDANGNFSVKLDNATSPHLVRISHQGVTYYRMAPPGTTSVEVQVYEVAKKVDGVSVTADVMRFRTQGSELQCIQLFAVNNASDPPRTQMSDQSFEFYLPNGAQLDQSMAMTAGGQPINSAPVPQKQKNRYAFLFPLRPGETQFQVSYHMPYSGEASFDLKTLYGAQHFVVVLPKTMQFTAGPGATFQSMQDPRESDAVVQVASNTTAGQPLAFKISGTGRMSDESEKTKGRGTPSGGAQTSGAVAGRVSRPGGGLGPPIDAPDPLQKYRWYILGGLGILLVAGAVHIFSRFMTATVTDFAPTDVEQAHTPTAPKAKPADRSALLLGALKEEIFQLEVEHKQCRISQQEYEKAKAALDQTLERAVKRVVAKIAS
jgi:hypothetical protein